MTDRTYLEQRAETELVRARTAADPAASKAHYELAALYLDRLHGGEKPPRRPTLHIVSR